MQLQALLPFAIVALTTAYAAYVPHLNPRSTAPFPSGNSTTSTSITPSTVSSSTRTITTTSAANPPAPTATEGCDPQGCFAADDFAVVFWWDHSIFLGDPDSYIHVTLYGAGRKPTYYYWGANCGTEHVLASWLPHNITVILPVDPDTGYCGSFGADSIQYRYGTGQNLFLSEDAHCATVQQTSMVGTIRCVVGI